MTTNNTFSQLDSLLNDINSDEEESNNVQWECPLSLIHLDMAQTRTEIDETKLIELSETLKSKGLIQPISLRVHPEIKGEYMIVAGERRFRAATLIGWERIPSILREVLDDGDKLITQLIENGQRENISFTDEAATFKRLIEVVGMTQNEIAKGYGKPKSYVSETVKIDNSPDFIKKLMLIGVSRRAAVDLISLAKKYPEGVQEAVEYALENSDEISLKFVKALKEKLSPKKAEVVEKDVLADLQSRIENVEDENEQDNDNSNNELSSLDNEDEEISEGEQDASNANNEAEDFDLDDQERESTNEEQIDFVGDRSLSDAAFKKRPRSKAIVNVKVKGKGFGSIALDVTPLNPDSVIVEFSDGVMLSVPLIDCEIIGYE